MRKHAGLGFRVCRIVRKHAARRANKKSDDEKEERGRRRGVAHFGCMP